MRSALSGVFAMAGCLPYASSSFRNILPLTGSAPPPTAATHALLSWFDAALLAPGRTSAFRDKSSKVWKRRYLAFYHGFAEGPLSTR